MRQKQTTRIAETWRKGDSYGTPIALPCLGLTSRNLLDRGKKDEATKGHTAGPQEGCLNFHQEEVVEWETLGPMKASVFSFWAGKRLIGGLD